MPKPPRGGQRGSGGSGGSSYSGGAGSETTVTTQIGTAQLNQPIEYTGLDSALSGAQRSTVEGFERAHLTSDVEHGMLVDENGVKVWDGSDGNNGSVSFRDGFQAAGNAQNLVLTHNHPRSEDGVMGGSFSQGDLGVFVTHDNVKTMRASAAEGSYSITKSSNFDGNGFYADMKKTRANARRAETRRNNAIERQARMEGWSWERARQAYAASFNQFLTTMHNAYIAGQQKYGYTYNLERR